MACATLGCGRQTASSRAKFCRECFLENARANNLKRRSFRGGGVVGNKGGRGVVGNKGNTTVGQSKINAAEKRKSFQGNTETGQSKRNAGKRSGLMRRAARRHMKDDPLLTSKAGCRSAVDAGTHLGRGGGGGLRGKMLAGQQRTSTPRRLVPPLRDPVWQEGDLLYVDSAFDPTGLSERVLSVTSGPHIKAQHGYRGLRKGVGSFNFGVVPHMGIPSRYLPTHRYPAN